MLKSSKEKHFPVEAHGLKRSFKVIESYFPEIKTLQLPVAFKVGKGQRGLFIFKPVAFGVTAQRPTGTQFRAFFGAIITFQGQFGAEWAMVAANFREMRFCKAFTGFICCLVSLNTMRKST